MPAAQKKVILRTLSGDSLFGYLPPCGFVREDSVAMLDPEGRLCSVPLAEIKAIFYVRDFNRSDLSQPERLMRRTFAGRPRGEGLWVRLTFRQDGDVLEGLVAPDIGLLSDLLTDGGLQIEPPDSRSNTQRIYVPRVALSQFQVLSVITSPSRRGSTRPATRAEAQPELFAEPIPRSKDPDRKGA